MNGPILTETHKILAAQRIALDLRLRTLGQDRTSPATWLAVAAALKINTAPYPGYITASRGRLLYASAKDKWIIEYNTGFSATKQAEAIVHELAHWYQREKTAEWLCDEPVVYWYEGRPDDEQHKIARRVEELVVR